jgi:hypothetical protein
MKIFKQVEDHGAIEYSFDKLEDATRFRFACYRVRHNKCVGESLSFILNTNEMKVLITKTPKLDLR